MKVRGGMLVLRRVATTDVAANEAEAQMHPAVAGLKTVFAPFGGRSYLFYVIKVSTLHSFIIPAGEVLMLPDSR
jgi:hypothetical protein